MSRPNVTNRVAPGTRYSEGSRKVNGSIPLIRTALAATFLLGFAAPAYADDLRVRSDNQTRFETPADKPRPQSTHRAKLPAAGQLQVPPRSSKGIEGSPIGPNGDPILVWPPEEYEYPKCCDWACSCEPLEMDAHGQLKANAQIMAAYKKTSWDQYKSVSDGNTAASDLPPSDCPPEPVQVCRDSWKPKIINPFPGKDIKTINPFE